MHISVSAPQFTGGTHCTTHSSNNMDQGKNWRDSKRKRVAVLNEVSHFAVATRFEVTLHNT